MQPFCQNPRKLCQSLAKGKSQRAPTPAQSLKALWAKVSNKKRYEAKYPRLNMLPSLIIEVKAISKSCINVVVAFRLSVSCRGKIRVEMGRMCTACKICRPSCATVYVCALGDDEF